MSTAANDESIKDILADIKRLRLEGDVYDYLEKEDGECFFTGLPHICCVMIFIE